jgi:hypothetical protein
MASKDGRFPPSWTDYKELLAVLDITLEASRMERGCELPATETPRFKTVIFSAGGGVSMVTI